MYANKFVFFFFERMSRTSENIVEYIYQPVVLERRTWDLLSARKPKGGQKSPRQMPTRMKCVLRQRQVQHNGDSLYDNIVPVFGQCPAVKLEWSRHLTANNNNLFRYQSFCATRHIPVVLCVFHRTVGTVMPTRVQNTAQVTNIFISIEFIY